MDGVDAFFEAINAPDYFIPVDPELRQYSRPTEANIVTIIKTQFLDNRKFKDFDKIYPRGARIIALRDSLLALRQDEKAKLESFKPADFPQEVPQWRWQVKDLYQLRGKNWVWSRPHGPNAKDTDAKPLVPLKHIYAAATDAHLNDGKHLGRDAMFARTKMASITKDFCAQYISYCPGCADRLKRARAAHKKTSNRPKTKARTAKSEQPTKAKPSVKRQRTSPEHNQPAEEIQPQYSAYPALADLESSQVSDLGLQALGDVNTWNSQNLFTDDEYEPLVIEADEQEGLQLPEEPQQSDVTMPEIDAAQQWEEMGSPQFDATMDGIDAAQQLEENNTQRESQQEGAEKNIDSMVELLGDEGWGGTTASLMDDLDGCVYPSQLLIFPND